MTTCLVDKLAEGRREYLPLEQFSETPESFPVFLELRVKGIFKNFVRVHEHREHMNAIELLGEAALRNQLAEARHTKQHGCHIYDIFNLMLADPTWKASTAKTLLENTVAFATRRIRFIEQRLDELEKERCKSEGKRPRMECKGLPETWDKKKRGGGGSGLSFSFKRHGRGRRQAY